MTRLLLVRHGITDFNSTRRFAGYSDVDLSVAGYRQVEQLCLRLAGEKIDAIYSSDLKRAFVAAQAISAEHHVDIITCPELREANYGSAEGLTFDDISRLYPDLAVAIRNFSPQLRFPGGESFSEFIERTSKFLERVAHYQASETVLIVSHSGPLRVLVCRLLGIDMEHWRQIRIDNASLSIVETHQRGAIVNLLNDTSHLKD